MFKSMTTLWSTPNTQEHTNSPRWRVWKGSYQSVAKQRPLSRQQASKLWHHARKWERNTRTPGKHGGVLGRTGLAVLYSLLFDFHNFRTGRTDPSVKTLANAAAVSERSAHYGLKRLRDLGLLNWFRRCHQGHDDDGNFVLKQDTNVYVFGQIGSWLGYRAAEPPAVQPWQIGASPPLAEPLERATAAVRASDTAALADALALNPLDPLTAALQALGQSMGVLPGTAKRA